MHIRYLLMALLFGLLMSACQEAPKADAASVTTAQAVVPMEGEHLSLDTAHSEIEWIGTKPTGKHHGRFKLSSGTVYLSKDTVSGGHFVINMKSLENIDLLSDTAMKNKLESELKGTQFLEVDKFPEAIFDITGIARCHPGNGDGLIMKDATHMVQGNLTIRQITKNISFPVKIDFTAKHVITDANFNIDRSLWGMNYRIDKSMQDKLINATVNISLHIVANR
ncbi:Polyisoprenoid-binding protein YceI [Chitinophaga costaii]|uniref:Polyisoprenoid-binding protein YceI n=1 Tax=Chitinophaga costaii TaxID=1335309 RepID=A0A1C4F7R2_9BACT|nr:YceI family protein [Chitinophaga costaii]PUZ21198.1 YceI family protein [Chitinophaga costaii]SCC52057.1 Polyisoprenoid-binding protein YceI [Chitinophaga costaii]